tara:strand:+ start:1392 stop:4613 length:3222 start_codon:yes stop_codon:yes gene_type:complete
MPITIKEIIASDTISQLVDKTNFNFDQLLLNGGGPTGPAGVQGPVGPAGGRGPKGTTWYEDIATSAPGTTPTANFPTLTPLSGDYYLQFNGQVWEYTGLVWSITTINLQGPMGPQGPGGGMGDTFGSPTIGLQTAIYNGTIGLGAGATTGAGGNEGIASVMIGGAVTTTTQLTGIPLTNAYVIPDSVATQLISSAASLLIHQKDSTAKAIVFHGGYANLGDKFYQTDLGGLSNIKIGVDDRLILSVPKASTSPSSINDLIGFELDVPERSQLFTAGKAITFQTGDRSTLDLSGENSNFDISVGTGSSPGGNQFSVTTSGTAASAIMQMGTGFTTVTNQNARVGDFQIQTGNIGLVSSANNNIKLFSGGTIDLETTNGSNPVGRINLLSGVGGMVAQTNDGTIQIKQNSSSGTATADILIENASTAGSATAGGDIRIQGNSLIVLKKTIQTSLEAPSIVIDYTRLTPPSDTPTPFTRFVGKQTISPTGLSGITYPSLSHNTLIYKNPETVVNTANTIFELTGTAGVTDYAPGIFLQAWTGGPQSTSGVEAGLLTINLGSEGPVSPVIAGYELFDNSLGFGVRDQTNTKDYFNASANKISFGAPWVLKRANDLNSSINSAPTASTSTGSTASAPINYGWNTRQVLTPQQASPNGVSSLGMPTTADLNVPFISLNFGVGLGYTDAGATFDSSNEDYDYKVNFPIGAYPGQRLMVKLYVQPLTYTEVTKSSPGNPATTITLRNYGEVELRIPQFRIASPSTASYTSWWGAQGGNQTVNGYARYVVNTSTYDSTGGKGRFKLIDMIWDGQVITQTGQIVNQGTAGSNKMTTKTQHGWAVTSEGTGFLTLNNNTVAISGYNNTSCFVAGTEISLANGDIKNIEDILSGEEVITWNESTKTEEVGTVGKLKITEDVVMIIRLTLNNSTVIETTEHHPFYHRDGKNIGLIDACDLRAGMVVLTIGNTEAKIESVVKEEGLHTVYNLIDVSGNNNFYVNETLVHNKVSDIRLKENYNVIGKSPSGIPIYEYSYIGKPGRYVGAMAQDLIKLGRADAVTEMANGYYSVNYNLIDVEYKELNLI